jgi:predicted O-methyltransferase YrrM
MKYDLSHLTQNSTEVYGPIQDDEALLLYSLIRCMGLKYIVEVGGLFGYSARNFLKAIGNDGKVITIDRKCHSHLEINKILTPNLNLENYIKIIEYAHKVDPSSLNIPYIDLLFLDAHDFESQMVFISKCKDSNMLTEKSIIVLHDTGCAPYRRHEDQIHYTDQSHNSNFGFVSPPLGAERKIANKLTEDGYCNFHVSANNQNLPNYIKTRHGLTILFKPYMLLT